MTFPFEDLNWIFILGWFLLPLLFFLPSHSPFGCHLRQTTYNFLWVLVRKLSDLNSRASIFMRFLKFPQKFSVIPFSFVDQIWIWSSKVVFKLKVSTLIFKSIDSFYCMIILFAKSGLWWSRPHLIVFTSTWSNKGNWTSNLIW